MNIGVLRLQAYDTMNYGCGPRTRLNSKSSLHQERLHSWSIITMCAWRQCLAEVSPSRLTEPKAPSEVEAIGALTRLAHVLICSVIVCELSVLRLM